MLDRLRERAGVAIGRQLAHPAGLGGKVVGAAMRVANRQPTRAAIAALGIRPTDWILDIGCGDGSAIAAMTGGLHVCGLDASPMMIEAARSRNREAVARGKVSLRQGDMLHLPFGPETFDKFAALNILYFCPDVPAFVAECRRVAKPGARLVLYVTSALSMQRWRFASAATHRHFDASSLAAELERAGVAGDRRTIETLTLPGGITGLVGTISLDVPR